MLLKEAHLANFFRGDAAGGEIRDGAGSEFQARVRDVDFVGDHGNSDGAEIGDGRIEKREENVEIVNHEVVDDVDIEAARRKNAEAMNFEKEWARDNFFRGDDGGIEALEMPDLQDAAVTLGRGDQCVGFFERSGDRLFDEQIDSLFEQPAADARMLDRRDGEAHGIDVVRRSADDIGKRLRAEFGGDGFRAVRD